MAKRSKSIASRGSVNNIILDCLLSGDKYGYEIIKEVEKQTNGKIKLKQPSLYSSLKRFEQKGYITSYWGDSDIGGRRHYYSLTALGKMNHRSNKRNDFDEVDDINKQEITQTNEEVEQTSTEDTTYELDESYNEEVAFKKSFANFSVDERLNSLLSDDNQDANKIHDNIVDVKENDEQPTTLLIDENFDEDTDEKELINTISEAVRSEEDYYPEPETFYNNIDDEMLYDHHFYKPIPLTQMQKDENIEEYDNPLDNETLNYVDNVLEDMENANEENEPDELGTPTPHVEQVAERANDDHTGRIVTDAYGITKIVYGNEDVNSKNEKKVFDNVILRSSKPAPVYEQLENSKQKQRFTEVSEEEREQRNQKFMERFDSITQEKTSSTIVNKDYKNKLNNLLNNDFTIEEEEVTFRQNEVSMQTQTHEREQAEAQDTRPSKAVVLNNSEYNVKMYEHTPKERNINNSYLLINKAKFVFGIIMLVVMILQITVCMMIIKQHDLLYKAHFWVYQVAYAITAAVTLFYCLPVFISPNKQATSRYRLNYSLMFGLLAFLISLLLIYSINTFMGFEYSNLKSFLTPILVPAVLASNFVFGPIIFKLITLNKKMY